MLCAIYHALPKTFRIAAATNPFVQPATSACESSAATALDLCYGSQNPRERLCRLPRWALLASIISAIGRAQILVTLIALASRYVTRTYTKTIAPGSEMSSLTF